VPQELTTFAQKHDIQVLTHNDPAGKYYLCSLRGMRKPIVDEVVVTKLAKGVVEIDFPCDNIIRIYPILCIAK